MSINLPPGRALSSARATVRVSLRTHSPQSSSSSYICRRSFALNRVDPSKRNKDPILAQHLKQKPSMQPEDSLLRRGNLDSRSSIFSGIDEIDSDESSAPQPGSRNLSDPASRNIGILSRVLDPVPSARERWQRKMVIRSIQRRGRLTKAEYIARTERSHLSKSHLFKTSVKKLMLLARQIAGKDLDSAMLQMRYSKKKVARSILAHLEHAKNEAIVTRGMGLGTGSPYIQQAQAKFHDDNKYPAPVDEKEKRKEERDKDKILGDPEKQRNPGPVGKPAESPMWKPKDKSPDETRMYIAQAWVGRGKYDKELEYRARGRVNMLRKPWTSVSVLLKEEKTRIRETREKMEKEARKRREKVWTQLPDRKVVAQRQYYCW